MPTPDFGPALPPAFFDRDPVAVARDLLGRMIVRREAGEDGSFSVVAAARVVESEAYDCPRDPSCYVIEKLPGAKEALRGPPGRIYFHKSYEHWLLNVVCMPPGYEATILVRAVEPVFGTEWMRGRRTVKRALDLTNGPAKLVRALGIEPRFNGLNVDNPELFFASGEAVPDEQVSVTARVGLTLGAALPWRFLIVGNPWVSPGKPSA